jgi:hypothetical protein
MEAHEGWVSHQDNDIYKMKNRKYQNWN